MPPDAIFVAEPLRDALVREIRPSLLVLLGAVTLVLLIACANAANLLLARSTRRKREIAIRSAIGAGRGRIARQLLIESIVLSLSGGAFGLALGAAGIRALLAINPGNIPRIGPHAVAVTADARVVMFTFGAALLTGVLFGLIPGLQASRIDLVAALNENTGRSGAEFRRNKARSLLTMAEMSLALVLLIGSGLLIRTFLAMRAVDPGFDPHNVLNLQMSLAGPKYQTTANLANLVQLSLERLRAIPGVEAAGAACCLPLGPVPNAPFTIVGQPLTGPYTARGNLPSVSPGYFELFRIPLLQGRGFTDRDNTSAPPVVVINEAMARRFWPKGDALGARISLSSANDLEPKPRQIVGIVGEVHERTERPGDPPPSNIYVPISQVVDGLTAYMVRLPYNWAVRTRREPHVEAPTIKGELQRAAGFPVVNIRSMDEIISGSTARQDFSLALMTIFGSSALLLAAIGIYGLMAYSVEQRTQEVGIRMALGAAAGTVRSMIVLQGMRLALAGVAIGVPVALGLTRLLTGFLYGVKPVDPLVFASAPLFLCLMALAAVWIRARRASRIDPAAALRRE